MSYDCLSFETLICVFFHTFHSRKKTEKSFPCHVKNSYDSTVMDCRKNLLTFLAANTLDSQWAKIQKSAIREAITIV